MCIRDSARRGAPAHRRGDHPRRGHRRRRRGAERGKKVPLQEGLRATQAEEAAPGSEAYDRPEESSPLSHMLGDIASESHTASPCAVADAVNILFSFWPVYVLVSPALARPSSD